MRTKCSLQILEEMARYMKEMYARYFTCYVNLPVKAAAGGSHNIGMLQKSWRACGAMN